jgi:hypothetical protein
MKKLLLLIPMTVLAVTASGQTPAGKPSQGLYLGQVLDSLRSGKYDFHRITLEDENAPPDYYKTFSWAEFKPLGRRAKPCRSCIEVYRGTNGAYSLGNLPSKFGKLDAFVFPYEGFTVFHLFSFGGTTVTNHFVFDHQRRIYYNFHYGSTQIVDSLEWQATWPLRNIMELDSNLRVRQRIGLDSGEVWFRSSFSYNRHGRAVEEDVAFIARERGSAPGFRANRATLGQLFRQPPPPGHQPSLRKLDLPWFFRQTEVPIWACDLRFFYEITERFFNGFSRDGQWAEWP